MSPLALEIKWEAGIERVPLTDIVRTGQRIQTTELWPNAGIVVSYTAIVEAFSKKAGTTSVRLRYNKNIQKDLRVKEKKFDVSWGLSELSWNAAQGVVSAMWTDDRSDDRSGPGRAELIGGETSLTGTLRKTTSVVRTLRPEQAQLRDSLLLRDKCCVLTGEDEIAALEAAHVIPVEGNGADNVRNAILLRADVHGLFDQNLFWFALSKDAAVVKCAKNLSLRYRKLLDGKKLPPQTFAYVKRALRLRATMAKT